MPFKSLTFVLALAGSLSVVGCAAMQAHMEANMAAQAQKNQLLLRAAKSEDGYEDLGNMGAISVLDQLQIRVRNQKTGRFKFCARMERPFLEPGESDRGRATYLPDQRREVEGLLKAGKLPDDRYYVSAGGGVYVSVPNGDRSELARNVDAGHACFWSEETIQTFAVKHDGDQHGVYHVAASKWDGVLRPHDAPPNETPVSSTPGARASTPAASEAAGAAAP